MFDSLACLLLRTSALTLLSQHAALYLLLLVVGLQPLLLIFSPQREDIIQDPVYPSQEPCTPGTLLSRRPLTLSSLSPLLSLPWVSPLVHLCQLDLCCSAHRGELLPKFCPAQIFTLAEPQHTVLASPG